MIKYKNIQKGLGDVMGGKVLDYEAKDIYRSGIAEGMAQGVNLKLVTQIQKKLDKGHSIAQIAEALEESVETIESLIKANNLL